MKRRDLLTASLEDRIAALSPDHLSQFTAAVELAEWEEGLAETPVMRRFREWSALYRYLNSDAARALPEAEFEAQCDRRRAMELHLASVPSVGVADFAAKVLALTNDGDHELDAQSTPPAFWAEARALVGEV